MSEEHQDKTDRWLNWQLDRDDQGIAWLCIDLAEGGVNVLSGGVLRELDEILGELENIPPKGLVLYSGKDSGFIMGADINEFTKIDDAGTAFELVRLGQGVVDRLAALPCPSVAVINGFALGGGLEVAMACRYRIGLDTTKRVIGLPEVQLGLHPGFGGTVRAVELAGVRQAMDLMLTGKSITLSKARGIGLVDDLVGKESWRESAVRLLNSEQPRMTAPFVDRMLNLAPFRGILGNVMRKQVARKARKEHYPSPYAIVDLWVKHGAKSKAAYEAEARSFAELMVGSTSRNLVRVFFLQNRLKSQGKRSATRIERVHVIGAGVMGGDIAAWSALRGCEVTLQDASESAVRAAVERAQKLFDRRCRSDEERKLTGNRLQPDVQGQALARADLVIEAIFEDLDAKKTLYREVVPQMKDGAILATNTSSIRLEDLRSDLPEPRRLIGLHFFNPVSQMPLVEVVRCADTDRDTLDAAFGFVKSIGKLGLECSSAPGFVVNRVLGPYMAEAVYLANEGVSLRAIDDAAVQFGMPMGPVELADTVGLDVAAKVSEVLGAAFNREPPSQLAEFVAAGKLGKKSGEGFYKWTDGKPDKGPAGAGFPDDAQDRLILPLVNEAVACLADGVVSDADLLDAGIIFGTGFCPFRGGPLQYARERGVEEVRARLEHFADTLGERYKPHPGWQSFS